MKYLVLTFILFSNLVIVRAQDSTFKNGDLVFADLDCGELCDAIEAVTSGAKGQKFSHVGIIYRMGDSVLVVEAIGEKVQMSRYYQFKARTNKPIYHARIHEYYYPILPNVMDFVLNQLNVPYDEEYKYDNGKYYCSEFIYDAFRVANHYEPVFDLEPMTFKQPGSNEYYPAWVKHFKKLRIPIPEGEAGISPGSLSKSNKLVEVK